MQDKTDQCRQVRGDLENLCVQPNNEQQQRTTNEQPGKYRAYPDFLLDWLEFGNLEIGNKANAISAKLLELSFKVHLYNTVIVMANLVPSSSNSSQTRKKQK